VHRGTKINYRKKDQEKHTEQKLEVNINYIFLVPATKLPTAQIICPKFPVIRLFSVTNFLKPGELWPILRRNYEIILE
jgi:hypothetical protein